MHIICGWQALREKEIPAMTEEPRLYIIAGCNGAGKTTASMVVLPEVLNCREFVNADEIAKGLSPFDPSAVAFVAGRLMLTRISLLMRDRKSFAIETTLSTGTYRYLVRKAHEQGYQVVLIFFWLPSPAMAQERVAKRVSEGGHNIPPDVIERRYYRGLENLFDIFMPIVDAWMIFDNSSETSLVAHDFKIVNPITFEKIKQQCRTKKS